ncbi:ASCH domain-containing protein [Paenibacillus algorifonticola]|uniref:ASCH domain-containing protein n=1 Tax=Paenibacillus algorifonticola TaxID=684063 RepID=A0A1I1XZV8_9BACL|nr:ASCH domain-containing protein [Paenibacillus algorifonticola]SFE11050.1 ASCH domain-containing protein [Paenibacillus algorifonticola]
MKAITIIQPWATLIALGEKKFETRSWSTKHRGELAIHAGKKVDREACETEPIKSALAKYGYTADNLPTGAIVATCQLEECWQIERLNWKAVTKPVQFTATNGRQSLWAGCIEGNKEYHFGNYEHGRYAWELSDVKRLVKPFRAKGQQGLWNW